MKANGTLPQWAWRGSAALSLLLGACVGPVPPPTVAPRLPSPRPAPPPSRTAAPTDWQDMPTTSGLWLWRREGGLSLARFGDSGAPALLTLTCNPPAGTITIARSSPAGAGTTLSITTTTLTRVLPVRPTGDGTITVVLSARDPLLDAMAFSRGRFAVEMPGLVSLYLPSWPEVSRVIEDCR